jgi:4-hydroxybenzoate polyprenyltransferase
LDSVGEDLLIPALSPLSLSLPPSLFLPLITARTPGFSQDKLDDVKVSVKSTALLFGTQTLPILSLFSASFLSCLAYSGFLAGCSTPFWLISLGGTASHLFWQLRTVDLDKRSSCWRIFRSNFWLGGVVALGIGADYVWRVGGGRELFGAEAEKVEERVKEGGVKAIRA